MSLLQRTGQSYTLTPSRAYLKNLTIIVVLSGRVDLLESWLLSTERRWDSKLKSPIVNYKMGAAERVRERNAWKCELLCHLLQATLDLSPGRANDAIDLLMRLRTHPDIYVAWPDFMELRAFFRIDGHLRQSITNVAATDHKKLEIFAQIYADLFHWRDCVGACEYLMRDYMGANPFPALEEYRKMSADPGHPSLAHFPGSPKYRRMSSFGRKVAKRLREIEKENGVARQEKAAPWLEKFVKANWPRRKYRLEDDLVECNRRAGAKRDAAWSRKFRRLYGLGR